MDAVMSSELITLKNILILHHGVLLNKAEMVLFCFASSLIKFEVINTQRDRKAAIENPVYEGNQINQTKVM